MRAIILLGAPGSGKGTAAGDIINKRGYEHLSTGDMLRESVRRGDELGQYAKGFMDRGELIPDEVIDRIVAARIARGGPDAKYLLDGFPRSVVQAGKLDELLAGYGAKVNAVMCLEVPTELIIRRMSGRRSCKQCGAVYNIHTQKPKVEGVCDNCGIPLVQRADDEEATVRKRLDIYERQTAPLIDLYEKRGILHRVDSTDRLHTELAVLAVVDEVA